MRKFLRIAKKVVLWTLLAVLVLGGLAATYFINSYDAPGAENWGLTFSQRQAEYLGYDWRTMYLDILNDLHPKNLRLMTYWDDIEKTQGIYDFHETAEMLVEAGKRNINVILVVGLKQPRWPECHIPGWASALPQTQRDEAQLDMVKNAVTYYKQFSAVKVWQVENEPMFGFGDGCPQTPAEIIQAEMNIVRAQDNRPILLTDSGELGRWLPVNKLNPDIFGSTMYRVVENPKLGYFKYPLPPAFFHLKAGLVQKFTNTKNIIGVELQAEPWFTSEDVFHTDMDKQNALMNPKIFNEYVDYAKRVGYKDNYLWGVEWWYWLAHSKGDWGMWDAAKHIL